VLYTDLAARTKNIRFSPIGLVLPSWDPIRCAEEIAVLDHLTKGRIYAGFARGYQDRWVNVLGQQYHATGAPMDGSAIDNRKPSRLRGDTQGHQDGLDRRILQLRRRYYKVPHPYNDGITRCRSRKGPVDLAHPARSMTRAWYAA
jgi:hypothetical protein